MATSDRPFKKTVVPGPFARLSSKTKGDKGEGSGARGEGSRGKGDGEGNGKRKARGEGSGGREVMKKRNATGEGFRGREVGIKMTATREGSRGREVVKKSNGTGEGFRGREVGKKMTATGGGSRGREIVKKNNGTGEGFRGREVGKKMTTTGEDSREREVRKKNNGTGEGFRGREVGKKMIATGEGFRGREVGNKGKAIGFRGKEMGRGNGGRGRVEEDDDSDSDSDFVYENDDEELDESEEEIETDGDSEDDDDMEDMDDDDMEGGDDDDMESGDEMECDEATDGRAARSVCYGHYKKPPKIGQPKLGVVEFIDEKTIKQPKYKRTLKAIMRAEWKYETAFERGRKREAFLNKCVRKFRRYYYYPEGFTKEEGNSVVKEHLKRNLKQNMFIWKRNADKQVAEALKKGKKANRLMFKPHFLEEDAWRGCCDYWESTGHKKMSKTNTENRKKLTFPHASGAMPFEERRLARELKTGEVMSELELFDIVYTKKHAELMKIKEAMERAAHEFASQTSADDPPPSPATCRKRNILIALRARKLKKGKIFMNPNKTIHDVLGPEEAAEWTSLSTPARIPNHAYDMMGRALNEVIDMVQAMDGINDVPRSRLDEELRKLADAAYPSKDDPVQRVLWDEYIKVATSFAISQFERFKKVIVEDTHDVDEGNENGYNTEDYEGNENRQDMDDGGNMNGHNMDDDGENRDGNNSDMDGSFNNIPLSP